MKREIRANRTRARLKGTKDIPRLSVFTSNNHIFAQLIDDENGNTLLAASDTDKGFKKKGNMTEIAKEVGKNIAGKAKDKKIGKVVFDRGSKLYHGQVKSLADGAREGGLVF